MSTVIAAGAPVVETAGRVRLTWPVPSGVRFMSPAVAALPGAAMTLTVATVPALILARTPGTAGVAPTCNDGQSASAIFAACRTKFVK